MNEQKLYRRILRREGHRSRSVAVSVVLVILALGAAYAGIEATLAALGQPPLLVTPQAAIGWVAAGSILTIVIAGVVVLVGVILLIIAIAPGRRPRHEIPSERLAIVVDDGVLAGALARDARETAQLGADRVRADVSKRRARVFVSPTSGVAVDAAVTRDSLERLIGTLSPRPALRTTVDVATTGVVGS
jgi:hypothetical protein